MPRIAYGPWRRLVVAGGSGFSAVRLFDTGANLVYAFSLDPNAAEDGLNPASFFIYRLERLSTPTRVYFYVGGTARYPGGVLAASRDYSMVNLATPPVTIGTPYVDILANETYAIATLNPNDDALAEPAETATFSIIPNTNYEVGTPSKATLSIADNDGYVETIVNATADVYVRDGAYAAINYGAGSDLQVKNSTSAGNYRQAYVKFNISGLTTFNGVKLRLYGSLSTLVTSNVAADIYTVANQGWSETGITYNTLPVNSVSPINYLTVLDTTPRVYEVDVTGYVKAQKTIGKNQVSFMIKGNAPSSPYIIFNSREAGNGPVLVVQ